VDKFSLFSTPVFVQDIPGLDEINRELRTRLQAESLTSPGVRRANVGGWHSPPDLATRPEQCYRDITRITIDKLGEVCTSLLGGRGPVGAALQFGVQSWAMVMRHSDYTILHDHGDAHWSTTYYVDAGDADMERSPESGALALLDPRRGGRPIPGLESGTTFLIRPRTGMLVVFPGWLQHYVHPYKGARPRIIIATNAVISLAEAQMSRAAPSQRAAPA